MIGVYRLSCGSASLSIWQQNPKIIFDGAQSRWEDWLCALF